MTDHFVRRAVAYSVFLLATGSVAIGCGDLFGFTQSQRNDIVITIHPAPTPQPAGCSGILLEAEPGTAAGQLIIGLEGIQSGTLIINGAVGGPVSNGQTLQLASGSYQLQVVSGSCVSNFVNVEIP